MDSQAALAFTAPRRAQFSLPWPPSVNSYWRAAAIRGKVVIYTTREAKKYREDVGWIVGKFEPFAGEILMDVMLHPPTHARRDADNWVKCIFDSLQAARVFNDDAQVQSFRVTKGAVVRGGMVEVAIWERGNAEADREGEGPQLRRAEGVPQQ